jgi:hypothetical protein
LDAVTKAVEMSTVQVAETRKSSGRLLKAIESLAEKIERTNPPTDGFRQKIDDFADTLDRMLRREAERIEKTRLSADAILAIYKEMESRALDSAVVMEACKKAVDDMQASMTGSTTTAKRIAETASTIADELLQRHATQISQLQRVEQMSAESETFLRDLRSSLESQVQMSAGALAALERNVVQASELIVRELNAQ